MRNLIVRLNPLKSGESVNLNNSFAIFLKRYIIKFVNNFQNFMKKFLPLVFLVLFLSALGYFVLTNKNKKSQLPAEKKSQTTQEKPPAAVEKIKDLISQNIALKCIHQGPEGFTVTTYLKGKDKIRTTVVGKEGTSESIVVGGKLYAWESNTKQGIVMTIDKIKRQPNEKTIAKDPQQSIEELEQLKAQCRRENFSDSIFTPPAEIKFQDFDQFQNMMPPGNFQIPTEPEEAESE